MLDIQSQIDALQTELDDVRNTVFELSERLSQPEPEEPEESQPFSLGVPPGFLYITVTRDGNGWTANAYDNGYTDKIDYTLVDVSSDVINGTTAICEGMSSADRNPAWTGEHIDWNFTVAKGGVIVPGSEFTLVSDYVNATIKV